MIVHAYTATPRNTPESHQHTGYVVPGTGDTNGELPASWHHGKTRESLHSFLSIGLDYLVVAVPLTVETTHLLAREELRLMSEHCMDAKSKPFLANISRGRVIDQDALIQSLNSGELSGAALDMTDPHPLPKNHPLWDTPNLRITPHISGLGESYFPRSFDILKSNLERMKEGLPLINQAHMERGY